MYVEGDPGSNQDFPEYFELRVDGPYINEMSKDYYRIKVDVNLLCSAIKDNDTHRIHRLVGSIASFCTDIGILRYGDGDTFVGCLRPSDEVKILHFGQIMQSIPLMQAAVRVMYTTELTREGIIA